MTTTTEITAALDAQRAFLLDLLARLCGDEAWQYAEQTLGIPSSWNAFQAWWKAQPEHDEVAQAKMRANGHRAAAVQQARRARGVVPDTLLAAPTDPERVTVTALARLRGAALLEEPIDGRHLT